MRPAMVALAITMIALAISATPATAATTRAEYVGQVNQVCGSFSPQLAKVSKSFKKLGSRLKGVDSESGAHEKRRFNRLLNDLGRYIGRQARILGAMPDQVALVAPAPGDEAAVSQWLQGLRQFATLQGQQASALRHHKFGRAAGLSQGSFEALNSGGAAVKDWGIRTCPVTIDVSATSYE